VCSLPDYAGNKTAAPFRAHASQGTALLDSAAVNGGNLSLTVTAVNVKVCNVGS